LWQREADSEPLIEFEKVEPNATMDTVVGKIGPMSSAFGTVLRKERLKNIRSLNRRGFS
jgi:hypothetical protein